MRSAAHAVGGHVPRRRFGQHFLVDAAVVESIIHSVAPRPGDRIVEIGPGLGALTAALLDGAGELDAIEIDRDLALRFTNKYPRDRVRVHAADALTFDYSSLGAQLRLVGNLPYNISSPLLFHLAAQARQLRDAHFMLQKEVVDRMAAPPGSKTYGRLSVMLQYRFAVQKLFDVPASAFRPAPRVGSAFVRLLPHQMLPARADDERLLAKMVAQAFSQRRKTLRNALSGYLEADAMRVLGIEPNCRPETLTLEEFVRLSNAAAVDLCRMSPPATLAASESSSGPMPGKS